MLINRRALLATASAALVAPRVVRAATVADDAGRSITVPRKVHRVFPAGPAAAILLYTLAPELLLGWPRANTPGQCAYMLADICTQPEVGRLTERGNDSLQSVIALKPDLILDVGTPQANRSAQADRIQKESGIPCALLNGGILSLSTSYQKLGKLIDREIAGADFADYCNQTLAAITNRLAFVPPEKRPRAYYAHGPDGLVTGLGGASHVECIELVARNVAGGSPGELTDVTIDQVHRWDPDFILATEPSFVAKAHADLAWASMRAVHEGRVYAMPRVPFGWVDAPSSGNRLIGLWWLVKKFYPEIFKDDLRELTRDFYTKFYHVTPTDLRIDYVLAVRD